MLLLFVTALLVLLIVAALDGLVASNEDEDTGNDGRPRWRPDIKPIELDLGSTDDLPESIDAVPDDGTGHWRVTFTLPSSVAGDHCAVAGDFNGWSVERTPMARAADGRWRAEVTLGGGVYRYKFHVAEDRWIVDPANGESEDDGFESRNSILRLGSLGRSGVSRSDVRAGEAAEHTEALEHDPSRPLYRHGLPDGRLRLRYRTFAGDSDRVSVLFGDGSSVPMEPIDSPEPFCFWQLDLPVPESRTEYTFALHGFVGDGAEGDPIVRDPRVFDLDPDGLRALVTPDWAKGAVWYQIFPERFRNGDPSNDPERVRPWTSDWTVPTEWEGADGQSFWEYYVYERMYGGDLAGIEEKLDHIVELGVTAIYLNPIFQAEAPHKYNATDFRHVDVGLGAGEDYDAAVAGEDLTDPATWGWTPSDRVFLDFLRACKSRGLRVVLDAVFNHVGVRHPAFVDVRENGLQSRFADWFSVRSWDPFEYVGWAGFDDLPEFAKEGEALASDAVKEHLFAITRRWMDPDGDGDPSDGIDGWRLDVPMELPAPFWEEWRTLVKSINPDAYIAGEIWHRADEWLGGAHFDAVMNYRFADPVVAWVGNVDHKIAVSELDRRLLELRLAYPDEATHTLMNLVGSHDTDRIASMLLNRDRPYDRSNQTQRREDYDNGRPGDVHFQRVRLIALVQATYVGAPMIYYGDEVGMWGADDPTNRKPMLWEDLEPYECPEENHVMEDHHAHYREVMALRGSHGALRTGTFRTVVADDAQDLWVYERGADGEALLVALNASSEVASFELPEAPFGPWEPCFGDAGAPLTGAPSTCVAPIAGRVWRSRAPGA
ncbi:MAG: alpha-amylase family glycosyl hydrolase [Planctomycetota bacterium]